MIPLDRFELWTSALDESARLYLSENEARDFFAIPPDERADQLRAILSRPISNFSPINEAFFRARWAQALAALNSGEKLTLLEIASGDADMIPQMMARVYPGSRYITANMNKRLTHGLRQKTAGLPLEIGVIEDDAAYIDRHLQPATVDIIAFQHAVNDVIQAILCDREGVDTIHADWMATLPRMIAILQREIDQDTLEQHARLPFLSLLANLLPTLKPGGWMVMNHYMFQLDLDWGYPPDLWENLVPIVREWLKSLPGCQEVPVEGFHPQWWIFLRKS